MVKVEPNYTDSSVGFQLEQNVADGEALQGLGLTKVLERFQSGSCPTAMAGLVYRPPISIL
jgi:hypothetical protein